MVVALKSPQMKRVAMATLTALAIAYGPAGYGQTSFGPYDPTFDPYDPQNGGTTVPAKGGADVPQIAAAATISVDGDDGDLLLRNISYTPDWLTEFANVQMTRFYVPAQNNLGVVLTEPLSYTRAGETTPVFTRTQAKPLFAAFNDGPVFDPTWINPVTGVEFKPAFKGHGKRDAWTSFSFDDGNSWLKGNLSVSGNLVVGPIFVINNSGQYVCDTSGLSGSQAADLQKNPTKERCDYFYYGDNLAETPDPTPRDINPVTGRYVIDSDHLVEENVYGGGDATSVQQAVIGNKILVAWTSKLCDGTPLAWGNVSPLNTLDPLANPYGVKGLQGYTDYALMKAEGEIGTSALNAIHQIGKVPHSCLWVRRGYVVENAGGGSSVLWWAPERLTSGVRDAYKHEIAATENAGFAITWQEDPEGLLPGSGEGPGEGWSGSTVNHKTDVWYSYLHLKNFVNNIDVPVMSVPVPITDNAKCPLNTGDQSKQFCYADNFSYSPVTGWTAGANGLPDLCADGDLVYNSCIAEDGRFMEGQTGASRPRMNLQAYCIGNNDPETWATSCTDPTQWGAWAAIAYEESKGKGDLVNEKGVTLETGKNQRFHSFEFTQPQTVKQGLLLNPPAKRYPGFVLESSVYDSSTPGVYPDTINPGQPAYDDYIVYRPQIFGNAIWNAPLFDTEIARRASITSQGVRAAYNSTSKTSLLTIFKQGLVNQGGPADIMFRRFVLKDGFLPGSDNPFGEMACNRWATASELGVVNNPILLPQINGLPNPNYLDGLCLEPAPNVSATTPTTCDGNSVADPTGVACGYGVTNPFIYRPGAEVKRVFTWSQTQGADSTVGMNNLVDESWTNPWDVAKGHRGILDGDFVMMQYAWSPNEFANAVGRDTYNLYIRRSFDGGQTWTATPNSAPWTSVAGVVADGTNNCETFREPVDDVTGVPGTSSTAPECMAIAAGGLERARDLSLITDRTNPSVASFPSRTVLDPRYSPTGGLFKHASTAFVLSGSSLVPQAPYASPGGDIRNPSKYFIAYDDGDNRTVAGGAEAEPLNMFYTQALNWGDDYTGWEITFGNGSTITRLPLLSMLGTNASESSIAGNPDGTFMYSVWNEWQFSDPNDYVTGDYQSDLVYEDAIFRRLMFLDGE